MAARFSPAETTIDYWVHLPYKPGSRSIHGVEFIYGGWRNGKQVNKLIEQTLPNFIFFSLWWPWGLSSATTQLSNGVARSVLTCRCHWGCQTLCSSIIFHVILLWIRIVRSLHFAITLLSDKQQSHSPWLAPGEEPAVKTIILDDKSTAKRAAQRWAREKEAKAVVGFWMRWKDGSYSDDGRVGVAAECEHCNEWRACRSYLGTRRMEVVDGELWAIGLALGRQSREEKDSKDTQWKWSQSSVTHKLQFDEWHT